MCEGSLSSGVETHPPGAFFEPRLDRVAPSLDVLESSGGGVDVGGEQMSVAALGDGNGRLAELQLLGFVDGAG
jgi:hypothetical protein